MGKAEFKSKFLLSYHVTQKGINRGALETDSRLWSQTGSLGTDRGPRLMGGPIEGFMETS